MYVLNDYIINGVRTSVVTQIDGYSTGAGKPRAYPYGLFVYEKVSTTTIIILLTYNADSFQGERFASWVHSRDRHQL